MVRRAGCLVLLFTLFAREAGATEISVPGPAGPRIYDVSPGEWQVREASGRRFVAASDRRAALANVAPGAVVRPVLYPRGFPHSPEHRRVLAPGVAAFVPAVVGPDAVAASTGATRWRPLPAVPGMFVFESADDSAEAVVALVSALSSRPGVTRVTPIVGAFRKARALPNDPLLGRQWHLVNEAQSGGTKGADIDVAPAWAAGLTGQGIRISIVDDGMESTHPDLAANAHPELGYDYRDGDPDPSPEGGPGLDPSGDPNADAHGTAVAGIAGAVGDNHVGVTGVAYHASLVPVRLVGPDVASDEQEANALGHRTDVVDVSNNSWGPSDDGQTVEMPGPLAGAALEAGSRDGRGGRGVIYVWSGGNGGENDDNANNDGYANSIHVIAVGAATDDGVRASYSEPGACLVAVAPAGGNPFHLDGIVTTDLVGNRGYNDGVPFDEISDANYTQTFEGTSASAPVVSGIVALMLEANPALGWRDAKEILIRSSRFVDPEDPGWFTNRAGFRFNPAYGAGLVDAFAATQLARAWTNLSTAAVASASWTPPAPAQIPDGSAAGISHDFPVAASLRVEHVRVTVDIRHPYRGELAIDLISPGGTTNHLFLPHVDPNRDLAHRFMTVQCWGEDSAGNWRVRVVDSERGNTGSVRSVRIEVFGTSPDPLPGATLSLADGGGNNVVSIHGTSGERWRVDSSADLRTWSAVGEAELVGDVGDVADPAGGVGPRYYRAIRQFP